MDVRLREILKSEKHKEAILGIGHKQKMTNKQIFEQLVGEGFDSGNRLNGGEISVA